VLALVFTTLFALYVIGPDLAARWVLGFIVPRRSVVQSRSEEVSRALLWAAIPLTVSYLWARYMGHLLQTGNLSDVETFFSGIYSEAFFSAHRELWFHAAKAVLWLNICLLWRLYCLVLVASVAFLFIIHYYGRIRERLKNQPWILRFLSALVLPRVSEWHVMLSEMLLPSKNVHIHVDILAKSGIIYRGRLASKSLNADGSLSSITLEQPERFRRDAYLEAMRDNQGTPPATFWKSIPGNMFVLLGSEISSLNLRYTPTSLKPFAQNNADIGAVSRKLLNLIEQKQQSLNKSIVSKPSVPPPGQ
jgi:hypothetical protein